MNKRYLVKLNKQERKELSQLVKKERIAAELGIAIATAHRDLKTAQKILLASIADG